MNYLKWYATKTGKKTVEFKPLRYPIAIKKENVKRLIPAIELFHMKKHGMFLRDRIAQKFPALMNIKSKAVE